MDVLSIQHFYLVDWCQREQFVCVQNSRGQEDISSSLANVKDAVTTTAQMGKLSSFAKQDSILAAF